MKSTSLAPGVFLVILCLSACTTSSQRQLAGSVIAGAAGDQVGYSDAQCFKVKSECVEGHYEQWQTRDGKQGCTCNN